MKRMLVAGSITALTLIGTAGAASAAPADLTSPGCFGQVHKLVNSGAVAPFANVGDLVQAVGGPAKNATATGICGA